MRRLHSHLLFVLTAPLGERGERCQPQAETCHRGIASSTCFASIRTFSKLGRVCVYATTPAPISTRRAVIDGEPSGHLRLRRHGVLPPVHRKLRAVQSIRESDERGARLAWTEGRLPTHGEGVADNWAQRWVFSY